jgi:hypothetical protein
LSAQFLASFIRGLDIFSITTKTTTVGDGVYGCVRQNRLHLVLLLAGRPAKRACDLADLTPQFGGDARLQQRFSPSSLFGLII